jgi:hypothetical protein
MASRSCAQVVASRSLWARPISAGHVFAQPIAHTSYLARRLCARAAQRMARAGYVFARPRRRFLLHAGYALAQPCGRPCSTQDTHSRNPAGGPSCTQDCTSRSLRGQRQNARRMRAAQPSGRPILPAGYVVAQLRGRPILHRGYAFAQPRGRPSHYILYMRNLRALTPLCIIARLNHLNICAYAAHKSNIALLR